MLKSLSVENYALIESAYIDWTDGFSVITGETGSGKSILLGALGLIQGNRADVKTLKDGGKKCVVEAEFDVSGLDLHDFYAQNDMDDEDGCIIRREISPIGKSRAFVNDTPVPLFVLRDLSIRLIDIHSQHETLLLQQDGFQLHVLDVFAGLQSLVSEYSNFYKQYLSAKKKLANLSDSIENQKNNRDYIEFQAKQLHEAKLAVGEQEELEKEADKLSHANELKEAYSKALWLLSDKDNSVCSDLKTVGETLRSMISVNPELEMLCNRIDTTLIDLKDVVREVEHMTADATFDPQRLEFVEERLDAVYKLEKRHKVSSVEELLSIQKELEGQLLSIDTSDEELRACEKEVARLQENLTELANRMSVERKKACAPLEKKICGILQDLGIVNARFEISMQPLHVLGGMGMDAVTFLFSANKNSIPQPMANVASGGELSRVMLALKYVLSKTEKLPTVILDEIDTGVSGDVADRMGRFMKTMGDYMQVISITHLPQIASKGKTHYKVYKVDDENATVSHIKRLTEDERITEIAQMLSGSNLSDAALKNAKQLLSENN